MLLPDVLELTMTDRFVLFLLLSVLTGLPRTCSRCCKIRLFCVAFYTFFSSLNSEVRLELQLSSIERLSPPLGILLHQNPLRFLATKLAVHMTADEKPLNFLWRITEQYYLNNTIEISNSPFRQIFYNFLTKNTIAKNDTLHNAGSTWPSFDPQ